MADDFERMAMDLSGRLQLEMSGAPTGVVLAALILMVADIALNVAEIRDAGDAVIDHIAEQAKDKMRRDWAEGKQRLHAARAASAGVEKQQ